MVQEHLGFKNILGSRTKVQELDRFMNQELSIKSPRINYRYLIFFLKSEQLFIDSRMKGRGFEPHRRHCAVVLEQDTFILA